MRRSIEEFVKPVIVWPEPCTEALSTHYVQG